MKKFVVLFVILTGVCAAQQAPFVSDVQSGDRMLLGESLIRFYEPLDRQPSDLDSMVSYYLDARIYDPAGWTSLFEAAWSYGPTSNDYRFAVTKDSMFAGAANGIVEFFPLFPPQVDTLWLSHYADWGEDQIHYKYCTNTRVFDTTVNSMPLRAFTIDVYRTGGGLDKRYTVSDQLWLLRMEDVRSNAVYELSRHRIGEYSHDAGPYVLQFPNLCTDLEYHFSESRTVWAGGGSYYHTYDWKVRDTVVNNHVYYFLNPINYHLYPVQLPVHEPVRRSGTTLLAWEADSERVIEPYTVWLGDFWNDTKISMVSEVDSVDYYGKRLRMVFYSNSMGMDGNESKAEFYGGIGLFHGTSKNENQLWDGATILHNHTPCPFDPSAVPNIPALPRWQAVVYPSPARDYITVAIQHAATAVPLSGTLMITDELGRTVLAQQWDEVTERSSLTLPVAGFGPGVYYYRLVGSGAWLAGQFVVER